MRVCPQCGWSGRGGVCPTHDRVLLPPERRALLESAPLLGCTLDGRYVLVDRIGGGGGGVVYAALQRPLDRVVAVKILHGHLTATPQAQQRFLQEAKALSRLKSRQTVTIYDFGVTREQPAPDVAYMVMEFVAGESLSARLKRCGPMAPRELASVVRDLGSSLDEAHRRGIVHRDIKPRNIILGADPESSSGAELARLIDFGIASVAGEMQTRDGVTGSVIGTPHYMAPELCHASRRGEVSGRTDVYAVGVTMFEMLTGRRPYRAPEPLGILYQHVHSAVPPIEGADRDSTLAAVQTVVQRAMAKAPDKRYATVGMLSAAFDKAVGVKRVKTAPVDMRTGRIPPQMRHITAMYRMDAAPDSAARAAPSPVPTLDIEPEDIVDGSLTAENLDTLDTFAESAGQVAEPAFVLGPPVLDAQDTAALNAVARERDRLPIWLFVGAGLFILGGVALWWALTRPPTTDPVAASAGSAGRVVPATRGIDASVQDAGVRDARVPAVRPGQPPSVAVTPVSQMPPSKAPASKAPATEAAKPQPRVLARQVERALRADRCGTARVVFKRLKALPDTDRLVKKLEDAVRECGKQPAATGVPARVQIGNLDVRKGDRTQVKASIGARARAVDTCALRHDLLVEGRAILNLRLTFGDGRTRGARIRHSSTRNRKFDACALTAMRLSEVAGEAEVDIPLLIKPR